MRVLIVEDDPSVARLVAAALGREGFECAVVDNGAAVLDAVRARTPDLVILDLVLPGRSGLDVCRELRSHSQFCDIPVIMLTGLAGETERLVGLELGADDYILKPFNPREVALRVKAVLRRARRGVLPERAALTIGRLRIDPERRSTTLDGTPLELTAKEFDLLLALADARGRVLTRDHLLRTVWGFEHPGEQRTRTVDVHVRYLRRKLGAEAARLETFKGVGYRLNPDPLLSISPAPKI